MYLTNEEDTVLVKYLL